MSESSAGEAAPASNEAKQRALENRGYLLQLLGRVAERAADLCGRARVIVSDENLCDWDVEIRLPVESRLGRQLADRKTRTQTQDFVLMRFHFPVTFPAHPPVLCCIRPRLTVTNAASKVPLTDAGILRLPELSTMHWRPDQDLVDVVLQACTVLSSAGLCWTHRRGHIRRHLEMWDSEQPSSYPQFRGAWSFSQLQI
eukprot:s8698_g2.t1